MLSMHSCRKQLLYTGNNMENVAFIYSNPIQNVKVFRLYQFPWTHGAFHT